MQHFDFFKYDLNLLVAFDALLTERSVTRAARLVGIGQSGMSQSLAKLRDIFQEELFVRRSNGIEPTRLALQIAPKVRELLHGAHSVLIKRATFDPATTSGRVTMVMPEAQQALLLPELMKQFSGAAPGLQIVTVAFDRNRVKDQLESGEIDLAVGVFGAVTAHFQREVLYHDTHVCLYNPALVQIGRRLTLEQYLAHKHVLLSHSGDTVGVVDVLLGKRRLKRNVLAASPYATIIPAILNEVAAIGILPRMFAEKFTSSVGLRMTTPPVDTGGFTVSLLWHTRTEGDLAQTWLRDQVRAAARTIARPRQGRQKAKRAIDGNLEN